MSRGDGFGAGQVSVPWPQAWATRASLGLVLLLPVALVAALGGFALAFVALDDGDRRGVALGLAVGAAFALAVVIGVRSLRWGRRRPAVVTAPGGTGLCFPFSRVTWWSFVALVVVGPVAAAAALVADLGQPGGRPSPLAGVGAVVGLVCLVHWFNLATGRLRRGHLVLDAAGITLRTWADEYRMAWPAGRALTRASEDLATPGPVMRVRATDAAPVVHRVVAPLLGSATTRHLPDLLTRADTFAGDAAVVAHAVAFYRRHPEHRHELSTDAALGRVLEGRAVVPTLDPGAL